MYDLTVHVYFFVVVFSQKKRLSLVGAPAANGEDGFGVLQQLEIGEQVSYNTTILQCVQMNNNMQCMKLTFLCFLW